MPDKMYGFKVGDIVITRVPVRQSDGYQNGKYRFGIVPAGTRLIIVAIAAKVCIASKETIKNEPTLYDEKSYFYNAVVESEGTDGSRIRADFVTIKKEKPRTGTHIIKIEGAELAEIIKAGLVKLRPELVEDGTFHLEVKRAEIFGSTGIFTLVIKPNQKQEGL